MNEQLYFAWGNFITAKEPWVLASSAFCPALILISRYETKVTKNQTWNQVDMRTVSFDIPPQEILTKDSVTIAVDAVVYYKISNANGKSWLENYNLQ